MSNGEHQIHVLSSEAEIAACARLLIETFDNPESGEASDEAVASATYHIGHNPDIHPGGLRAIIDGDGRIIAQYVIHTRRLCIGAARLPVYCIGGVAVRPDARKGGFGSALIDDCLALAIAHEVPLLFLNGIAGYYHRFGYTPVLSETRLCIRRDEVRRLPDAGNITVRRATPDDAALILDLYRRHMQPVFGSFDRMLDEQRYHIDRPHPDGKAVYLIATDRADNPAGYLMLKNRDGLPVQRETAAGDWATVAALLKAHEARLSEPTAALSVGQGAEELCWQAPVRSRLFYAVVDHIPCRQETHHHPSADWMARLGDVDAYVHAMMPAWRARVAGSPVDWRVIFDLMIGSVRKRVQIADGEITLLDVSDRSGVEPTAIRLSPVAAAQLTFGFRSATHIAMRDDVNIPPELVELLATLYPQAPAGVAGSDYF